MKRKVNQVGLLLCLLICTIDTVGTRYEFDDEYGFEPYLIQIDATHYLCAYEGPENGGWAVVLNLDTSDWSLTPVDNFQFDLETSFNPSLVQIDTNHYLCTYDVQFGYNYYAFARVLTIDTSDWTISAGTGFQIDTNASRSGQVSMFDPTHYLCVYEGPGYGGATSCWSVILTVDTADWSISKETAVDIGGNHEPVLSKVDATHYLCSYVNIGFGGSSIILTVDGSDWSITAGTPYEFCEADVSGIDMTLVNDNHFICVYSNNDTGWSGVLNVDDTWNVGFGDPFEFFEEEGGCSYSVMKINEANYICTYVYEWETMKDEGCSGYSVILSVEIPPVSIDGNTEQNKAISYDNFPNPFYQNTNISFSINQTSDVIIDIYNLKGQIIKILENDLLSVGDYVYTWDGTDKLNNSVTPGVYFYRIVTDDISSVHRMIMIK